MSGKKLPSNWAWSRLGDLGAWSGGGTPSKANLAFWEDGSIPWVSPKDMKFGRIRSSENSITEEAVAQSSAKLIPANSILMVTRSGILAHSFPVAVNEPEVTVNQDLKTLTPADNISPDFLAWHLRSENYRILKECAKHGTTVASIDTHRLKNFSIPIAPLNEQHRIVEKIETLFAKIDKGEEALREVQKLLKRYRQSILKAAVTGELTRDWREANQHKLEPASDILARILESRRENWQGPGKYKAPNIPDTANLPELPEGWVWAPLEGLCMPRKHALKAGPFGSALKKSDYSASGYKIYGQEQVIGGDWTIGDYFIDEEKYQELQNCSVSPRDVLISLVGTIGKVLILPPECAPGIINPRLVKVSLEENVYLPEFFKLYFESSFLKALYKLDAHGATMDVLNLGIIRKLPYPLCSPEEQKLIVDRATEALESAAALEVWCQAELKRSNALRQSILKSAFTGQLVPQDPDDEPASELLARIRAEREATPKSKSRRKARV
ncbi:MAG: hypothetical protein HND55_08450 [Pseudomonadota bacterium]|nr:MAG: hypothetical protein HND55_08450 [Pseudomonadota bacterium]